MKWSRCARCNTAGPGVFWIYQIGAQDGGVWMHNKRCDVKLTKPQIEVLKKLAEKERETTVTTYGNYVSGICVTALARRGLVTTRGYCPTTASITDAGRDALKAMQS